MATKKIIFFTADNVLTSDEQATLAKLNSLISAPYQVTVMNSKATTNYAYNNQAVDYVCGTVPTPYNAVPVIDPDEPPSQNLPPLQAVVSNAQQLTIPITGVYTNKITLTVANNVVTAGVLS